MSVSAFLLGLVQFIFIFNFFFSIWRGRKVPNDNPWDATTLEWDTPTPPPHGNFIKEIVVYRGPYEYSVPGADKDFTPQSEPPKTEKLLPTTVPAHWRHARARSLAAVHGNSAHGYRPPRYGPL